MKQSKNTKEIAGTLFMSARTIETHRYNIRIYLGKKRRRDLDVRYASFVYGRDKTGNVPDYAAAESRYEYLTPFVGQVYLSY